MSKYPCTLYRNEKNLLTLHCVEQKPYVIMRRLLIEMIMLLACLSIGAQAVKDSNFRTVGYVERDGTIKNSNYSIKGYVKQDGAVQDASFRTVGYIKQDGTMQDASFRNIGYVKSDGTVQDSSYRILGYVTNDGTVKDSNYRIIGYAKDVPVTHAVLFFFFKLLK